MDNKKPMFVRIKDHEEVLNAINSMKETLSNSNQLIEEIESLKKDEEQMIEDWFSEIEEIENRINLVDESLFEPDEV